MAETKLQTFQRLEDEMKRGEAMPPNSPARLALKDIHVEPLVFQPRSEGLDQDHVAEISKGIDGSKLDERIHVWWSGRRWIVVDGHHRLAAYAHKATGEGEKLLRVPVEALGDTLREAIGAADRLNSRHRDTISREERMTQAWFLVCLGEASKAEQALWSGASTRQISIMRKTHSELRVRRVSQARLVGMTWDDARTLHKGDTTSHWTPAKAEAMAQEWSKKLLKALGRQIQSQPEVFARAIQIVSDRLPIELMTSHTFWEDFEEASKEQEKAIEEANSFEELTCDISEQCGDF